MKRKFLLFTLCSLLCLGWTVSMAQNKEIDQMNMITFDDDMLTTTSKLYFDGQYTYTAFGFQWEIHLGKPPKKKKDPLPPTVDAENTFGILIQKRDMENNLVWNKVLKLGDRNTADQFSIMFNTVSDITVVDRQIYITGSFMKSADFGDGVTLTSNGYNDMFVLKVSDEGKSQWAVRAGGSGKIIQEADPGGRSITAAPDGTVYAIGMLNAWPNGGGSIGTTPIELSKDGGQVVLMKFSQDGKLLWSKLSGAGTGGPNADMACDAAGNIYISGSTKFALEWEGNEIKAHGLQDAYLMKLNPNGEYIWGKVIGWGEGEFDGKTMDAEGITAMSVANDGSITTFMSLYEGAQIGDKKVTAPKGAPMPLCSVAATFDTNGNVTSTTTFDGKWIELAGLSQAFSSINNDGKIFFPVMKGVKINEEKAKKGGYYSLKSDGSTEFIYDLTYDSKVYLLYPHGIALDGSKLYVVGKLKKASDVIGGTAGKLMEKQVNKSYIYKRDMDVGLLLIKYSI